MKSLSIFRTELETNLTWHIAWITSLSVGLLILIGIYPGDNAMSSFVSLFQTPSFQDFFGNLNKNSGGYYLWIAFMIPFWTILLLIYAMMTGIKATLQSISDGTGELLYTLPVSRVNYIVTRIISNFIPLAIFYVFEAIIFLIPIQGHTVDVSHIFNIAWWGILFSFFGLIVGVLIGLLAGNTTKGFQFSIILVTILYALQIVSRVPSVHLQSTNNYNFLSFYQPDQYLMGAGFVKNINVFGLTLYYYPIVLGILSVLFILIGIFEFNSKDLSNDAGLHFNIIKRFSLRVDANMSKNELKIIKVIASPFIFLKDILFPKNVRNNPFVFWARIFENRMPLTADFIYSDNMILFIGFLAILMFYPLQMLAYPGDKAMLQSVGGFSSTIFLVFTYGHNLLANPQLIFLWYLMANTIGISWMILIPISFFWVRKAITQDGNSGTGEILGGIPLNSKKVIFQRITSIFSELVFLILMMIFWLLVSEAILNESYNNVWEILAILSMVPFYMFLVTFICLLALLFKRRGLLIGGLFLIGIVISFIVSVINPNLNKWYFRGIFDLYDPVTIIQSQSLFSNNLSLVVLSIMTFIFIIALLFSATRFTWLNITNKSDSQNS